MQHRRWLPRQRNRDPQRRPELSNRFLPFFCLKTLLQIVPRTPGSFDGEGDYALTLARRLRLMFDCETIFAACDCVDPTNADGFGVRPFETAGVSRLSSAEFDHVILHYVNY